MISALENICKFGSLDKEIIKDFLREFMLQMTIEGKNTSSNGYVGLSILNETVASSNSYIVKR